MEIDLDKMLAIQAKRLADINSQVPERVEDNLVIVDSEAYKETVSKTNFLNYDDRIVLTRYIGMKVRKATFKKDVLLNDILPYLDLCDSIFLKVCDKEPIIE